MVESTHINGTRANGCVPDTHSLLESGKGFDKADNGSLASKVKRSLQGVDITSQASHPQQVTLNIPVLQPVVNSNLRQTNRTHGVHSKRLVHSRIAVDLVLSQGGDAGGVPEGAGGGLVDACTVAEDVDATKLFQGCAPQRRDLRPVANVCLLEVSDGLALFDGRPLVEDLLGLGAQLDVGHHDGAAALEELLGEGQADALTLVSIGT